MLKTPFSAWRRLAGLAIFPFLAGTMFLVNPARAKTVPFETSVTQAPDTTKAIPFTETEVKPTFNGGDVNEFARWVNGNLVYPEKAKTSGTQGRLVLQFTVCADGKVRDAKVLRGIDPELDAEALRVVSASPDWTPGYVDGKPVNVSYTFPIIFTLRGDKKEEAKTANIAGGNASIQIRGGSESVLYILDGKEIPSLKGIDPKTIESINVIKGKGAVKRYGDKARNGVVQMTSKKE